MSQENEFQPCLLDSSKIDPITYGLTTKGEKPLVTDEYVSAVCAATDCPLGKFLRVPYGMKSIRGSSREEIKIKLDNEAKIASSSLNIAIKNFREKNCPRVKILPFRQRQKPST